MHFINRHCVWDNKAAICFKITLIFRAKAHFIYIGSHNNHLNPCCFIGRNINYPKRDDQI